MSDVLMPPATPAMPYQVREFHCNGGPWPHKVYGTGLATMMTEEEVRVVEYVRHLEGEVARLKAALAASQTGGRVVALPNSTTAPPPKPKR